MKNLNRSKVGRWVLASVFIILLFGITGCGDYKKPKVCHYCNGNIYYSDCGWITAQQQWKTDKEGNTYHVWCKKIVDLEAKIDSLNNQINGGVDAE